MNNVLGPSGATAAIFVVLWIVWVGVGIAAVVVFFRGMKALAQIPERLTRIERAVDALRGGTEAGPT